MELVALCMMILVKFQSDTLQILPFCADTALAADGVSVVMYEVKVFTLLRSPVIPW